MSINYHETRKMFMSSLHHVLLNRSLLLVRYFLDYCDALRFFFPPVVYSSCGLLSPSEASYGYVRLCLNSTNVATSVWIKQLVFLKVCQLFFCFSQLSCSLFGHPHISLRKTLVYFPRHCYVWSLQLQWFLPSLVNYIAIYQATALINALQSTFQARLEIPLNDQQT